MELGVALIDIGGGTTDLAIFCNGTIKHTWELALGGNNLTSDLSVGLRTPLQEAEELKYLYGGSLASMIKENHIIEVPTVGDRKPRKVSQRVMVEILEARMEEILQMVNKNISASGYRNRINAGIVLTGGTALLANIVELAEQVLTAISEGLKLLERCPFTCRKVGSSPFLRELLISWGHSGYVALFEIEGDHTVTVAAVRHQRESDYH